MKECTICKKQNDNPVLYGDFMNYLNISVHYYCLLLSTNLPQRGKDKSGILGFLKCDIEKLAKDCAKIECSFCGMKNASLKCTLCLKYFHLVCGIKNNCMFEFLDEFKSYCNEHHTIKHTKPHDPTFGCFICLREMGLYNPVTSISASCCSKGWVHIRCARKYALSAGYYLKCLWCNSTKFREEVRRLGVFVPDRDAIWEQQKDAYAGLYKGYSNCDAVLCLNTKGRNYKNNGKWKLLICYACGASGVHLACYKGKFIENDQYMCPECKQILHLTSLNPDRTVEARTGTLDRTLFVTKSLVPFQEELDYPKDITSRDQNRNDAHNNQIDDELLFDLAPFVNINVSLQFNKPFSRPINHNSIHPNKASTSVFNHTHQFVSFDPETRKIVSIIEGKSRRHRNNGLYKRYDISSTRTVSEQDKIRNEKVLDKSLFDFVEKVIGEEKLTFDKEILHLSGSDTDASPEYLLNKLINT